MTAGHIYFVDEWPKKLMDEFSFTGLEEVYTEYFWIDSNTEIVRLARHRDGTNVKFKIDLT